MDLADLERLIVDMKESLERQIHGLETALRSEMSYGFAQIDEHFKTQSTRLDRLWSPAAGRKPVDEPDESVV